MSLRLICISRSRRVCTQAETWEGEPSDAPNHGTSGPVKVSQGGFFSNVGQELLAVAKAYDTKRKVAVDTSDFNSSNAYGVSPEYQRD